ncbi:dipeptidase [Cellulomonas sp. zg-ZUI222]|uniref:M15 family metallopeptidase n=1 Tax=Cellulomonas TaxID=1707 RepID=UPI001A94B08E|nr:MULTISPECIES: M15 family metallopeptidase [Cellulomonas]MBO0901463.1 dipeptidase [Cellulomonas sp. zg-ZUI22]MBO0921909.1 dipeptidase [Cellulomonas wangleii]
MPLTCDDVVLLHDPRVAAVPVLESGDPLVDARLPRLHATADPLGARVRAPVARRLVLARAALPPGLHLALAQGWRNPAEQAAIVAGYRARVRADHPAASDAEVDRLTSRYVAPVDVAPHVAGAAVDVTLVDDAGTELDLGCPLDATPEESAGRCFTDAPVPPAARALRTALSDAMRAAGFVNYPTEWWHWSFGDRYWALLTGSPAALHGPVAA